MSTTPKKNTYGLQMPSYEDLQREAMMTIASAIDPLRPLSKDEQRIFTEAHKQLQIINYEVVKIATVQGEIGKLHKNAASNMESVVKHHYAIQEQAEGKPYQAVLEKFHEYDLNVCAQQQEKVIEAGFYTFMKELARSVNQPQPEVVTVVKERPPRSWYERLFGSHEEVR